MPETFMGRNKEEATDRQHRVLVYGTLRKGQGNAGLLDDSKFLGTVIIPASAGLVMLDAMRGAYPVAVQAKGSGHEPEKIVAELYAVNDATLKELDRLEAVPTLYKRHRVKVQNRGQSVSAIIYVGAEGAFDLESAKPAKEGDWAHHKQQAKEKEDARLSREIKGEVTGETDWASSLTKEEKEALESWSTDTDAMDMMKQALARGKSHRLAEAFHSAVLRAPSVNNETLYRGLQLTEDELKKWLEQTSFTISAYESASTDPWTALGFARRNLGNKIPVLLEITSHSGADLRVSPVGDYFEQREVVLRPKTTLELDEVIPADEDEEGLVRFILVETETPDQDVSESYGVDWGAMIGETEITEALISEAKMKVDPDAKWRYMSEYTSIAGHPEYEKLIPQAKRVIRRFFEVHPEAASRWTFILTGAFKASWDEIAFEFKLEPRGGKHGKTPRYSDPEFEKEMLAAGVSPEELQRDAKIYRDVKGAAKDVTSDSKLAYRGFSFEGWLDAKKKGHVESKGEHNLGDQVGTFWGETFETGRFYASAFAPFPVDVTRRRPGVIISRSRKGLLTHADDPKNIPERELVSMEPTPLKDLVNVWFLVPESENFAEQQLIWDVTKDTIRRGSGGPSSKKIALIKIK